MVCRTHQQGVPLDLQLDFPTLSDADQFQHRLVEDQRLAVADFREGFDHDQSPNFVITKF